MSPLLRRLLRSLLPPFLRARPPMPPAPAAPVARFAAAEARLHRTASALERASLDAVDAAVRTTVPARPERIGAAVAALTRRYHEAHRETSRARESCHAR